MIRNFLTSLLHINQPLTVRPTHFSITPLPSDVRDTQSGLVLGPVTLVWGAQRSHAEVLADLDQLEAGVRELRELVEASRREHNIAQLTPAAS